MFRVRSQQALPVQTPEETAGVSQSEALPDHRGADLVGYSEPRGAHAEYHYALIAQWRSTNPGGRDCRRQRDRPRALNLVIEGAHGVAITLEDPPSIGRCKVVPLQ